MRGREQLKLRGNLISLTLIIEKVDVFLELHVKADRTENVKDLGP